MKLKIDGKYVDVDFLSYMKFHVLGWIIIVLAVTLFAAVFG